MVSTTMQAHARKVLAHQAKTANGGEPETEALVPPDPSFVAGLAGGLKRKRQVTTPALAFPEGTAIICRITEAIHESKLEGDNRFGGAPAHVCKVEAPNGDVRMLIAGTVLRQALDKEYPQDGYVGAWFHIAKLPRPDKNYSDYAITEIEPPEAPGNAA